LGRLTKTPYLVLFVLLAAAGVGTAAALGTITFAGDTLTTGDAQVDGDVSIGTSAALDDGFLFFDGGAESLSWEDFSDFFIFSDDLTVVGNLQVTGGQLQCIGCVDSADIATDAVDSDEIKADAVDSDEIKADAVGASELATDAVSSDEIADDAVTGSKIAGTSKLLFGSCTDTVPPLGINQLVLQTCSVSGVTTSDEVIVIKKNGNLCHIIHEAITKTNGFDMWIRNICSAATASSAITNFQYMIFNSP